MSIVSVDNIQPIGSGTTVTVNKSVTLESGNTNITGVCTATSFSGALAASNLTGALPAISGANLTGLVSVANQADNKLITCTGTSNALNAETNLNYNGTKLTLTGNSADPVVEFINTSGNANEGDVLKLRASGRGAGIDDTDILLITNNTDTRTFGVSNAGTVNTIGNIIMASGKGIDFSAQTTSSASGVVVQSEKITHFEEGIYVPTIVCSSSGTITLSTSYNNLAYTRVGNTVNVYGQVRVSAVSNPSGQQLRIGLPFTSDVLTGYGDAGRVFGYARLGNAAQHQYYYGISPTAGNNDYVQIHRIDENTDNPANVCQDVDSNARIAVNFTYRAQ